MPALPSSRPIDSSDIPENFQGEKNVANVSKFLNGIPKSLESAPHNGGPLLSESSEHRMLMQPKVLQEDSVGLQLPVQNGSTPGWEPVTTNPYSSSQSELIVNGDDGFALLVDKSASESHGRMKRGSNTRTVTEKKLSILSVRDSEMDLLGLTEDIIPNGEATSDFSEAANGAPSTSSNNSVPSSSGLEQTLTASDVQDFTLVDKPHSANPQLVQKDIAHESIMKNGDVHAKQEAQNSVPSNSGQPVSSARPTSRRCCGGHSRPASESRTKTQPESQELATENQLQISVSSENAHPPKMNCPSSKGVHIERLSPDAPLDCVAEGSQHAQRDRQGRGLFQILLQEASNERLVLEGDGAIGSEAGGDNSVTMATSDASGEEPTPRPPTDNQPVPQKRRKSSRRTLCADPFAKLPKVKLRPSVWMEDDDELGCVKTRQGRKSPGRSPRSGSRHARHFEDPFKELAFIVFDNADVDCDKRLRRAEFTSILKSPSLELELSAEDIRKLEKDCSKGRKDIRDLPVSFDEFLPLAKYLLMMFYNKQDANSRNPWSILDRGRDCPPYYFNKHTGEVSADRPPDYDNQPELFLFEDALRDAFETADMDKDGKIHLNDFIRIINSEDFGLILTKRDIAEITKNFKNEAGKVDRVCYSEFLPLAKRLIVAVFSARDSLMDDWSYLCTRHVGAFWFNKRTGQSFRHPPNHFVTMQQQQLKHRKHEQQVLLKTSEELKVTKAKLEEETSLRKDFEEKYTSVSAEHAVTSKELQKVTRLYDKCRAESEKKTIFLDANEKEKTKLLYKIEQLEERVSEAERTETNLESMREVLRNCQTALREHELDIISLQSKIEDLNKQLSESEARVEDGKGVIADLHQQLREEIKRNEKMETELKKMPGLQKELEEDKESLRLCQKRLEEREAVLTLTRQVNRENKAKIKTLETELSKLPTVEKELEIAKCEIYTLKQLIVGKDSLVKQKSHELDSVKERLEQDHGEGWAESDDWKRGRGARNSYPPNGVNFRVVRLQKRRTSKSVQVGAHLKENKPTHGSTCPDISTLPYDSSSSSSQSDCKHVRLNDNQYCENPDDEDSIATSLNTSNGGFLRLLQKQGSAEDGMPTIYDLYTPEGSYTPTSRSASPVLKNGAHRRPKSSMARLESEGATIMQKGTLMFEDDFLAAQFIRVGDRVRLKKKGGKRAGTIQTGTVKFVGKVDKEYHHGDHRLYAGIRLDEAVGDTDGVIRGKRYFTVNPRHGRLVPISDVMSVLNPKTATYKPISESIRTQRLETGTARYERDRNPQLIRVM